eukprot:6194428-Pleurochrysis_carterae.AAC.5
MVATALVAGPCSRSPLAQHALSPSSRACAHIDANLAAARQHNQSDKAQDRGDTLIDKVIIHVWARRTAEVLRGILGSFASIHTRQSCTVTQSNVFCLDGLGFNALTK